MKNKKSQLKMKNRPESIRWFHATFYFFVVVFSFSLFLFNYTVAQAAVIIQRPSYIGLTSGLVGSWSFDGPDMSATKAHDRSGNGNDGTLTNGPKKVIGEIGQAIIYDKIV